jgi:hypothetical protein
MEGNYAMVVGIRGARLDILWKENIALLGVLENNLLFMIAGDSNFN